jgi:hypothetical protein
MIKAGGTSLCLGRSSLRAGVWRRIISAGSRQLRARQLGGLQAVDVIFRMPWL